MLVIGTVLGLAIADSLNPFSVAAMVYLLGTSRPIVNGALFTLGTFITYLAGGVLLYFGWDAAVAAVAPLLPPWSLIAVEVTAGALLLALGLWMWRKRREGGDFKPPTNLSTLTVLAFAVASTIGDLPTALPLFGAVNLMVADRSILVLGDLLTVAVYCALYCAPLLAVLAVRAASGAASEPIFGRVRGAVDWLLEKAMAPLTCLAGVLLVGDGLRRLL